MGPIGCPKTPVRNYHYTLRNIPEERRSQCWLRTERHKPKTLPCLISDRIPEGDWQTANNWPHQGDKEGDVVGGVESLHADGAIVRHAAGLHLVAGPMLCILRLPECHHKGSVGYNGQRTADDRAVDNYGTTAGETERNKNTNPKILWELIKIYLLYYEQKLSFLISC